MDDGVAIPRKIPDGFRWLDQNWPFAGTVVAAVLTALLPVLWHTWPRWLFVVYVLLVCYCVHQIEEHYGDRFRRYVNALSAGGQDVLTPRAIMWANVGGVWGVFLLTLLCAGLVDPGFGLVAGYTTLVNAAVHIVMALVRRESNPGLLTAVVLFLPFGIWALTVVNRASGIAVWGHLLGLGSAVLIHLAIVGFAIMRRSAGRR
ncbi:MAG: HXXEE domain-containing protein [Haloplanus sp.]